MTSPVIAPVLSVRHRIESVAYSALLLQALTPDTSNSNPAMVTALDDLTGILGGPVDFDRMAAAFGELLQAVADLNEFDADPESFLDRRGRPRTGAAGDVMRGQLLADREWWMARLEEMSR